MVKRGRPRKSLGGAPPPPDRKSFEQRADNTPPPLKRLRIEHLRFETFERPKIERAEQAREQALKRLEDMRRERSPNPADETRRPRPGLASPSAEKIPDVLVPMTCATKKVHFILKFTWLGALWGAPETIVTGGGQGSVNATPLSLDKMNFGGALCPCGAKCAPILCGACQQYVCDGGVEILPLGNRMHHCACGHSGILQRTLKEVAASKSAGAQAPGNTSPSLLQLPFKGS